MRLHRRADYAGHQAEVRREAVVETVHDVAQKSARTRLMPWLVSLAGQIGERSRVCGRFLRELQ